MNNRCDEILLEAAEPAEAPPRSENPPGPPGGVVSPADPIAPAPPVTGEPPAQPPTDAPPAEAAPVAEPNPLASAPLSVIMVARDEGGEREEAASAWIAFLRGLNRPFEVILVEDGFDDGAWADRLAEQNPEIRVLHRTTAQGLGGSLRDALALTQHPLIFYTLCNKQYQPVDLTKMLERILEVDVVTGCRIVGPVPWWLRTADFLRWLFCLVIFGLPLEKRPTWLGWTAFKHWLIARWLFGLRFQDPESAYCLFRREVFRRIRIQSKGAFAPIEILAKANFLVTSGAEVPVSYVPRGPDAPIFREALRVFQEPDFGPAVLPEAAPADVK